jgi:hypothetical protein
MDRFTKLEESNKAISATLDEMKQTLGELDETCSKAIKHTEWLCDNLPVVNESVAYVADGLHVVNNNLLKRTCRHTKMVHVLK